MAAAGTALAVVLIALELVLAWTYRQAFAPMLRARVEPEPVLARPAALTPVTTR